MGDVSDDDVEVVGAGRQEDEEPTLAEALGIMAQQKQAIEALQKCLAKLEKRDATTMDIGDLNDITGEHTRFVLFCFVWLATLGMPVLASCTAASTFRRVVEAP